MKTCFIGLVISVVLISCSTPEKKYSLAITNAKIWTGNPQQPWAESIIFSADTIVALGNNSEMKAWLEQSEQTIDAKGKLMTPGFIDSHVHTLMGGQRLSAVKLKEVKSKKEFITAIGDYAKTLKPGEWILGGDWDHQNWGGELPTHDWIDSVTKQNPVWLERSEGHSGLANQLALDMANVTSKTNDIPGGTIVRDAGRNPTGVFKDDAMSLIFKAIPDLSDEQKEKAFNDAMNYYLSEGITTAHHMVEPHERNLGGVATDYAAFKKMDDEGKLKVRFYIAEPFSDYESIAARIQKEGKGSKMLKNGALKGYVDGAIGSHSALFFDDYTDMKGFKGSQVNSEEVLYKRIQQADSLGLQLCIHAIGDKAIHIALKTFEATITRNGEKDRRFRIEHTQHIHPDDIAQMKKLKVIASIQPYHAIDDGIWCEAVIGPVRAKTSYASRSLMDAGVHVTFGSDWFVALPSPLKAIYAAVTRRTLDGKNPDGWIPEQKITVEQALINLTREGAYASFTEHDRGTLEPGKLADVVMLEQNIFEVDPVSIWDSKVAMTIVGGKIAYQRLY